MGASLGYWEPGLSIYQAGTARAADPNYFKCLTTWQPGTSKKILGHVMANQQAGTTYMIVRRGHRSAHQLANIQRYGNVDMRRPRTAYRITHSDYVVARQAWRTGLVEEMSVHATPAEARAAFRQLTGRGYLSEYRTTK